MSEKETDMWEEWENRKAGAVDGRDREEETPEKESGWQPTALDRTYHTNEL